MTLSLYSVPIPSHTHDILPFSFVSYHLFYVFYPSQIYLFRTFLSILSNHPSHSDKFFQTNELLKYFATVCASACSSRTCLENGSTEAHPVGEDGFPEYTSSSNDKHETTGSSDGYNSSSERHTLNNRQGRSGPTQPTASLCWNPEMSSQCTMLAKCVSDQFVRQMCRELFSLHHVFWAKGDLYCAMLNNRR